MGGSRRVDVRTPESGVMVRQGYVYDLVVHADSGVAAEPGRVLELTT
jgi:hypothetical protein